MSTSAIAVVVGVGPSAGLGAALARRLAREGLHVFIYGRTPAKLDLVAEEIRRAGGQVTALAGDASSEADVIRLFQAIAAAEAQGQRLELAVFSIGALGRSPIVDMSADSFQKLWQQNCFAGFLVGREAARLMLPRRRGTILYTGATASLGARAGSAGFASSKAALRAVAQSMARELQPQGIHVAHVIIDGIINGERARTHFPEALKSRGDDGSIDIDALADVYWMLHRQHPTTWTYELDLRPYKEPF
jgi:NAD(P)-dependent dehydrogenase (short-subunit alcohol dehydrogenase family)